MKTKNSWQKVLLTVWILKISILGYAQLDTVDIYPAKKEALKYLSRGETVEKFGKISDAIWSYAELGLQEYKSSRLLEETLKKEGFTVETGLAGMPTCFVASYGSGKPVIGILAEFDALPALSQKGRVASREALIEGAPGHGCGHNTMGTAVTAAAIAIKKSMDKYDIRGTIKVFGSPGEENLISRPYMICAGLFDGVDAVIDNHSDYKFGTGYGVKGSAMYSVIFSFHGKTAHAASAWKGRSALDAVELMNVATNYLREHLHFGHRMHYVITEGGEFPNVIPNVARVWYYLRNSDERIGEMYRRVVNCAKAAALATDTEMEIRCLTAIHQLHANKAAAELYQKNIELVGMPKWTEDEEEFARQLQENLGAEMKGMPENVDPIKSFSGPFTGGGSTDVGDVSLIAPTATIVFPGGVPGKIPHHWSSVACNYGSTAWKGLNAGAKAMAASAIDLLTKPDELKKIRIEFEAYSKEHPYKTFLPEDAKIPLDINSALMQKWRGKMEDLYLNYK
ncbi:amidohydrolase [Gaoshiqia sediminis]|uniref:Amidohydrolase n=1 Tax=Gaoshiqia sediminis TaxID=2986998 RepID=A0AA41Y5S0_9BACT|nr:amidohydrolase [Gaoshiqia sediminis]MCW0483929.1 amidohydrolase [Gaoshiqia sediminis]